MGLLTDVMMSKDKIKKKVEKAILEEMISQLSEELPKALREEDVNSIVNYHIVEDDF